MCGRLFLMERDKFKTPKIRPYTASDISVTPEECHPDYQLIVQETSVATDTAHLELFRLEPSDAKLPIFSARWDWRASTVDIDLLVDDEAARKAFKAASGGYRGHHTTTLNGSPLVYQVDIHTPAGVIFTGTITLSVDLAVFMKEDVGEMIYQIPDQLRLSVVCPHCGPVEVSGLPFVLIKNPKCNLPFRPTPEINNSTGSSTD
jgi:hypothetical protein